MKTTFKAILLLCVLSDSVQLPAYTGRLVISNDAINGSCGDKGGSEILIGSDGVTVSGQPACDGNYGWAQCESQAKFHLARDGKIDWRKVSWEDYCREKHADDPDDWKSGWRRSRLYRGCLTQFQMTAYQPTYRCFDFKDDPVYILYQQRLKDEKRANYLAFKEAYASKMEIFLNSIDPYKKNLEEEGRTLAAKIYELNRQRDERENLKKGIEHKISLFKQDFPKFGAYTRQILQNLDSRIRHRLEQVRSFYQDAKALLHRDPMELAEADLGDFTAKIRQFILDSEDLCIERHSDSLERIRTDYQVLSSYLDHAENYIEEQKYPIEYHAIEKQLKSGIDSVRSALSDRSVVFSKVFDSIKIHQTCKKLNQRYLEAQLLRIKHDRKRELASISENDRDRIRAIRQKTENQLRRIQIDHARTQLHQNLQAIRSALLSGRIERLDELVINYESTLLTQSETFKDDRYRAELKTKRNEFEDFKQNRLSLAALQNSLYNKLATLEQLIFDIADKPETTANWRVFERDLMKVFGSNGYLEPLNLPFIQSESQLYEISAKINDFISQAHSILQR